MHYYYSIIFLFICLFAFCDAVGVERNVRNTTFFISIFILLLTAGLKYETGVDWYIYTVMFREAPPIDNIIFYDSRQKILGSIDPGYSVLMSIIKFLGGSVQTVFLVMAFITSLFLWKAIKHYTEYPIVGLLIYYSLLFFILDMSGIRQGLTVAIFLYAIKYIRNRQALKYFMVILLASLFHWSSLILLPMYFILNKQYSVKIIIGVLALCIFIYAAKIKWLDSIVLMIIPSLNDKELLGKASVYTTSKAFVASDQMSNGTIIYIAFSLFIFAVLTWKRKFFREESKFFNIFYNVYVLQLIIFFTFAEFTEISDRVKLYLIIPNVVLIPMLIKLFKSWPERAFAMGCIAFYCFTMGRGYFMEMDSTIAYTPYQNYFVYKVMNYKSTGMERLYVHARKTGGGSD